MTNILSHIDYAFLIIIMDYIVHKYRELAIKHKSNKYDHEEMDKTTTYLSQHHLTMEIC